MSLYITQFIYLKPGQEETFDQFENIALPAISKYKGQLLLRVRPAEDAFIAGNMEKPYEIHLVVFDTENDFDRFMKDDERKHFLHLKEQSIRSVLLIKGIPV